MTPEQFERATDLFMAARTMDPAERDSWLAAACGVDTELKDLVLSLIGRHGNHPSFLERPVLPEVQLAAGRSIGNYEIRRELGRGGQAVVYLAKDQRLHRLVALKLLTGWRSAPPESMARFQREAEVASRLDHPAICTVYETGFLDSLPFIAMRHVPGVSLAERIASETVGSAAGNARGVRLKDTPADEPPVTALVSFVEKVARALHAAHEAGILHRDVKPGNVMVTPDGEPVLMDFGLARIDETDRTAITRTGEVFGTPAYMPPEQLGRLMLRLDRRADVWSLGVSLYEGLTLRRPFDGPTREALYQQILSTDPPDPRKLNPDISKPLATVVLTALEKDRDRRYQTALDFAEDLRRVNAREPILARRAGPFIRLRLWAQRNRALAAAVSAVIFALGLGLGTSLYLLRMTRAALDREREAAAGERDARTRAVDLQRQFNENTIVADNAKRMALHESAQFHFIRAQFAAKLGSWKSALDAYEQALDSGYEDKTAVKLGQIEAWEGLYKFSSSLGALKDLGERDDLGDHRAKVLFLQGALAVDRIADPDAGLDKLRQSLEIGGLSPSDSEYVKCLLSVSTDEAITRCRKALDSDPYNRRANTTYGLLLLLTGRRQAAKAHASLYRSLYPDDPAGIHFEIASIVLGGERKRAEAVLEEQSKKLGPESTRVCSRMIETFDLINRIGEVFRDTADPPSEGRPRSSLGIIPSVFQSLRDASTESKVESGDLGLSFRHALPPFLTRTGVGFGKYLSGNALRLVLGVGGWDELFQQLETCIEVLPDGVLYLLRGNHRLPSTGQRLKDDERIAKLLQSEADFVEAASRESIFRETQLCGLLYAEWTQEALYRILKEADQARAWAVRDRGRATYLNLLGHEGFDAIRGKTDLVRRAIGLDCLDVAEGIAVRWTLIEPENAKATAVHANVCFLLGAYDRAVWLADMAIARDPANKVAQDVRERALGEVGKIGPPGRAVSRSEYK